MTPRSGCGAFFAAYDEMGLADVRNRLEKVSLRHGGVGVKSRAAQNA